MTLQELLEMVPEAEKVKRVPSVARLASEARPIVCDAMDDNNIITIYDNGFVLYQKDQRATVFPLHDCVMGKHFCEERPFVLIDAKERERFDKFVVKV